MLREVRILRPAQPGAAAYFGEEVIGSRVTALGSVDDLAVGPSGWRLALAETAAGETFPWQYHRHKEGVDGIVEIAVILAGQGVIEVGEEDRVIGTFHFTAADVVLIPSDLLYRVRNTGDEPLRACLFFSAEATTYWADGREA
jgi:cupin superfamily acireductone dioxygenase involved in methionine salvage